MNLKTPALYRKLTGWKRTVALAIVAGVVITGFALATRKLVQPLHARGWASRLTSMIDSVAGIVEAPGREVAMRFLPARFDRIRGKAALPLNLAFWSAAMGVWLALARIRLPRRSKSVPSPSPVEAIPSRRRFLGHALQGAAAAGAVGRLRTAPSLSLGICAWSGGHSRFRGCRRS